MHLAAFAADHPPLDRAGLAALAPGCQEHLRLQPHPATAMIVSETAFASLFQTTHRPHAAHSGQAPPRKRPAAETALVGRGIDCKVWMRRLMPDEAAFVACLLRSGTLDAALAAAYASDATFDIHTSLSLQIEDQVWIRASCVTNSCGVFGHYGLTAARGQDF